MRIRMGEGWWMRSTLRWIRDTGSAARAPRLPTVSGHPTPREAGNGESDQVATPPKGSHGAWPSYWLLLVYRLFNADTPQTLLYLTPQQLACVLIINFPHYLSLRFSLFSFTATKQANRSALTVCQKKSAVRGKGGLVHSTRSTMVRLGSDDPISTPESLPPSPPPSSHRSNALSSNRAPPLSTAPMRAASLTSIPPMALSSLTTIPIINHPLMSPTTLSHPSPPWPHEIPRATPPTPLTPLLRWQMLIAVMCALPPWWLPTSLTSSAPSPLGIWTESWCLKSVPVQCRSGFSEDQGELVQRGAQAIFSAHPNQAITKECKPIPGWADSTDSWCTEVYSFAKSCSHSLRRWEQGPLSRTFLSLHPSSPTPCIISTIIHTTLLCLAPYTLIHLHFPLVHHVLLTTLPLTMGPPDLTSCWWHHHD